MPTFRATIVVEIEAPSDYTASGHASWVAQYGTEDADFNVKVLDTHVEEM